MSGGTEAIAAFAVPGSLRYTLTKVADQRTGMPNALDAHSILQNQYRDASRLDARVQLHAQYSTNTQGFHAWVLAHLHLPLACSVLEVGCGSGHLWLTNAQHLPTGWDITLSDLS